MGRVNQSGRRVTVRFTFAGRLAPDSFRAFAEHRAARLSLALVAGPIRPDAATMTVTGHPDLVDAFEMACSLGPLDCLVDEVSRRTQQTSDF